ncbi:MAG: coproporphyrinogen III oxidase family protein, partial [Mailhella sp.]|nr:coproporphyrinogen III oxidase family protein [Mailhella sp.]
MLLYIHVPFCRAKCRYCAFYSRPGCDDVSMGAWARAIDADLRAWGEALRGEAELAPGFLADGTDGTYGRHGVFSSGRGPLRPRVTSVFFGGGTPSLLSPALLGRLLDRASREFTFADGIEISMEANPESMTPEKAAGFRSAGVSRVSLGVQALDDSLLAAVGRVHSRADALLAYEGLRRAGFDSVGLDFIWGLPGESLGSWRAQLEEAAALRPDHLSCYGLTLEEGTPLFAERDSLDLPGEDVQAAMYADCGDILERHGYRQYEISNYALPGRECRHNLGY